MFGGTGRYRTDNSPVCSLQIDSSGGRFCFVFHTWQRRPKKFLCGGDDRDACGLCVRGVCVCVCDCVCVCGADLILCEIVK